jgi:hypothetical protein
MLLPTLAALHVTLGSCKLDARLRANAGVTGTDTAALPLLPAAGQLAQIDLSDDIVVAQLFGNGVWQELLEPLDAQVRWEGGGSRGAAWL